MSCFYNVVAHIMQLHYKALLLENIRKFVDFMCDLEVLLLKIHKLPIQFS